jgi:hypothetical protein
MTELLAGSDVIMKWMRERKRRSALLLFVGTN